MTPQYILEKSLCREPHCAHGENWQQTAKSEIANLGYAPGYAEPGYTDPQHGILLANWNYFPSRIDRTLEAAGYGIEWSDEWITCEECGKLVRTSADCYSWQPSYVLMNDCDVVCHACVDWSEYLESIEDDENKAVTRACDPSKFGYRRISEPGEFENGLHPGMNDKPHDILKALHAAGRGPIVFRVPETSQFYITFETWERIPESEETDEQ